MNIQKEMLQPFCPTCGAYKGIGPCINPKCPDSIYYKIERAEQKSDKDKGKCAICGAPAHVKCSICGREFCKNHSQKYKSSKLEPAQLIGSCKICGKIICSSCWVIYNGYIYCSNACIISENYADNQITDEIRSSLTIPKTVKDRSKSPLKIVINTIPSITFSGTLLNIPVSIMNYSSLVISVQLKFTVRNLTANGKVILFLENNIDLSAFDTKDIVFPLRLPSVKENSKILIEVSAISNEGFRASINKTIRCFTK